MKTEMLLTDLTLIELLEYVRRKATLSGRREDEAFSVTLGKAGLPGLRGARFEDDAEETVSMELALSPDLWIEVVLPGTVAGIIAAGARRPFLVATVEFREPRLKRPFALGADATRLMRRDAVAPTDRGGRERDADEGGGRSEKKLCGAVADAVTGGPRRPRMTGCCFSDFDLELSFASKDASGEGDTSTEGAGWSGGVAGNFSLFESDELLEELEDPRWEGVTNEVEVEAGVSSKLGVGGIGDERLVSRVKDGLSALVCDFLEDRPPMRNIAFHGLVGVDEPLRGVRKLSVDLEWEKTPRVCSVDVGMKDIYEGDVRE